MTVLRRTMGAAVVLSGLLLGGAAPAMADHWDHEKCEHRIHEAEERLDRTIRHHGEGSPQAEHRRHELDEVRDRCGEHRERREERREEHEEHEEHEHMEHMDHGY